MNPIDIIIIVGVIVIVALIVGRYIYKRIKHLPTGECSCCSTKKSVGRMVKNVQKEIDNECCCCKKTS
jgi:hypothetical protein